MTTATAPPRPPATPPTSARRPVPASDQGLPHPHQKPQPRCVLFVDHTAKMGGGEIALLNLVRHLDRTRYQPIVLLFADGPLAQKLREAGIETHVRPLPDRVGQARKDTLGIGTLLRLRDTWAVLTHVRWVAQFIREAGIDLVHTNSLKGDVIGGLAARLARRPLVWHIRDRIDRDYLPGKVAWLFRRLCRWLPDFVIANSSATLDTLELPRANRGETIHSGIELAARTRVVHDGMGRWLRTTASPDGAGQEHVGNALEQRAPRAERLVGLVGRISPWKGQHVFLRAAAEVRQRFPNVRFQIIGGALFAEHEYEQSLRRLADELALADAVEFTGFREDVPDLVERLEILVHASTSGEPFGQVVVEGMAAGKPVVATAGGGVPEIVVDGCTGLLVPMGDAGAMAAAICRLLEDPATAAEMGQLGRQRVREHFTIENTASKVEKLYDEVLLSRDGTRRSSGLGERARAMWPGRTAAGVGLIVSAGMIMAVLLHHLLLDRAPVSAPLLAGVALCAGLFGWRAGLAAVALSAAGLARFVFPPNDSFAVGVEYRPALCMFLVVGMFITWLIGKLRTANERADELRRQAESAQAGLNFIVKSGRALAIAAGRDAVLQTMGYLASAHLCTWCAVDLADDDDGTIRRAHVRHQDPAADQRARTMQGAARPANTSRDPAAATLRTGHPMLLRRATTADLTAGLADQGCVAVVEALGCDSCMIVPLTAQGRTFGSITLVNLAPREPYHAGQLRLATEFAWQAARHLAAHAPRAEALVGRSDTA